MNAILAILFAATSAGGTPADQPASSGSRSYSATSTASAASKSDASKPYAAQLKRDVATALRNTATAKNEERLSAAKRLIELFGQLGDSTDLSAAERHRLGAEVRGRLVRYQQEFRSDLARAKRAQAAGSNGAYGGPAAEGLDQLINVIQTTISPDDWVLAQQGGFQNPRGGAAGAGFGGQQQAGGAGGAGSFQQMTNANGQALADLIEDTVAPDSWESRGGPGKIVYFGQFQALVIRQTGETQDEIGDLIGQLRR